MRNYRQGTSNPLPGLYRARVEDINDPAKIGRVRIRVPQCHGVPTGELSDTSIKAKDLPWAYPCTPYGGGFDHGSFIVPEVGDMVWVVFESGNPNQPVYLGGVYGIPCEDEFPYGNLSDEYSGDTFKGSNGFWKSTPNEQVVPRDVKSTSKKVIYKSPKGATILIDEKDGGETLEIIDRLGQYLKFSCPVSIGNNSGNQNARRDKTVDDYDAKSITSGSFIIVKDVGGQTLKFTDGETAELTSKDCKVMLRDGKVLIEGSRINLNSNVYVNGVLLEDLIRRIASEVHNGGGR